MSISPSVRFPAAGCVDDPWRSHTVRIAAITDEVPGVRTYELHFEDQEVGRAYRFAAGQFNMLHLPGIGEAAISISSDVEEPERLAHTVRAVGNVTDALARMEVGETLMLRGPYGRPWPVDALAGRHAVIIGGGLGLALVPDFRIASPAARFGANFVKLGLHQGFGISVTLPRLIGQQAAAHMLLTGKRISGAEAADIGLVDQLVDTEDLRPAALSLAREIAENAPLAVMSVRATLRAGLAEAVAEATHHELKEQQRLRATDDAYEGIRAVAQRRPGVFTGT